MLLKKLFRTLWRYKAQFISMVLMIALGVGVFLGFNIEWYSLEKNTAEIYEATGFADYRIYAEKAFGEDDLRAVRGIEGVEDATRYLSVNTAVQGSDDTLALTVVENPAVSGMLVTSGAAYDPESPDGVWLSDSYAAANSIFPGDSLTMTYKTVTVTGTVKGLVKSSEYLICLPDETQMMPDYNTHGYAFISPRMLDAAIPAVYRLLNGDSMYMQLNVKSALEKADFVKKLDQVLGRTLLVLSKDETISWAEAQGEIDEGKTMGSILPVLFLAIAILTMVTTMHRITASEKTQIGTLKALGYSNGDIISKYMIYAGSGAVVGCGLGVLLGSVGFPKILWEAYKTMLCISDKLVLKVNWWLCGAVVITYTAVMLFVTWYSCRKALREEPAELIRPKAPEAGKKILVEYLPFWDKVSFLNKVTLRNMFRYKQRFAMMLLGIGGCTALLVTGFGLRDSITKVVDYQFQDVTVYDMAVYFDEGQSPEQQRDFRKAYGKRASILFYHQSNFELDHNDQTKEIYLVAADAGVTDYMKFRSGAKELPLPQVDEVLLSVGVAKMLDIREGDQITMRDSDMNLLELTVGGIYDNYVDNYAIIAPETIESQWGKPTELQMAFVKAIDGEDPYGLSADISGEDQVLNVSVSEDLAGMVSSMITALDMVVWVVVLCAGLLAAIVLYNLTNININERIREIATIKVLGFRAGETAMYVFKENLALTAIGTVFGLGLGYLLLAFVMSNIKIDLVWFKTVVEAPSYLWSALLTMLSAVVVDVIFYFKLDQINMAEALKSVE